MKSTFTLIDNLMRLLKDVPDSIDTEEKKDLAGRTHFKVLKYVLSLRKLIESHRTGVYLERLHRSVNPEIQGWGDKVTELLRKFDQLLINVEKDAIIMDRVIKNEPEKWGYAVREMAFGMVLTGLHSEEEEMKRFREIAIFEDHELREIIDAREHIAELLQ